MFEHYLVLKQDVIEKIWESGIIVFDANVLLHLYRYDEPLRQKLLSIMRDEEIQQKLWIPNKVYEEFLKNRPAVMCEQWAIEERVKSIISKNLNNLKSEIEKEILRGFHPYIDTININKMLDRFMNRIFKNIQNKKESLYKIEISSDSILEEVQQLTKEKIEMDITDDQKQCIYEEGEKRFSAKIPPGFEDSKKECPDCYSDLVIWKSILKKAKQGNDVIFVIDDDKSDWWRKEKGRTIGPNPQLLKEFISETGQRILFYNSRRFFTYVDEYKSTQKEKLTELETKQLEMVTSPQKVFTLFEHNEEFLKRDFNRKKSLRKRYGKEEILEWFWANFDDPAEAVPYMSSEGGYIYFAGGPYEANDEIQNEFPNIDKNTLEAVLDEIYQYGFEWVRKGQY